MNVCKNGIYLNEGNCFNCNDFIQNSFFVNCESVCSNCADSDICKQCINEYVINSSCGCFFGFELRNGSCI